MKSLCPDSHYYSLISLCPITLYRRIELSRALETSNRLEGTSIMQLIMSECAFISCIFCIVTTQYTTILLLLLI